MHYTSAEFNTIPVCFYVTFSETVKIQTSPRPPWVFVSGWRAHKFRTRQTSTQKSPKLELIGFHMTAGHISECERCRCATESLHSALDLTAAICWSWRTEVGNAYSCQFWTIWPNSKTSSLFMNIHTFCAQEYSQVICSECNCVCVEWSGCFFN